MSGPIFHDCKQLTEEWVALRCGIPTSSELDRIVTADGKASSQARGYMNRLLAEWVLGRSLESDYESPYMALGKENEQAAIDAFTFETGFEVEKIGFVTRADGMVGCSPDRVNMQHRFCVEAKCPALQTHIGYGLAGVPLDQSFEGALQASIDNLESVRTKAGNVKRVGLTDSQELDKKRMALIKTLTDGDGIADEYKVQVQSQLSILQWDYGYTVAWSSELAPVISKIQRDEPFIRTVECLMDTFVDVMLQRRDYLTRMYGPFVRHEKKQQKDALMDGLGVSEDDIEHLMANWGKD